jgi:hypothetical protein
MHTTRRVSAAPPPHRARPCHELANGRPGKLNSSLARRIFVSLACWLLSALVTPALFATTWRELTLAERCHLADRIVVGRCAPSGVGDKALIHVTETLKGPHDSSLSLESRWVMTDEAVKPGSTGIFYLRRLGSDFSLFHPDCFTSADDVPRVREVLRMFSEPDRFADVASPLDPDFAFVLSRLFNALTFSSPEIPSLGEQLGKLGMPPYNEAPWNLTHTVRLTCHYVPGQDPPVRIEAAAPDDALSRFAAIRVNFAAGTALQAILVPTFTLELKIGTPSSVGRLTLAQAVAYLHRCLASPAPDLIQVALTAMAELREPTAIPVAITLLQHPDQRVRESAIRFLEYTRDPQAVASLAELLLAASLHYFDDPSLANRTGRALSRMDATAALPTLVVAAQRGVGEAGAALGRLGATEAFPVLLDCYLRHPAPPSDFYHGLFQLVLRSNQPAEDWMNTDSLTEKLALQRKPLWEAWWQKHRDDFQVVRSLEAALKLRRSHP